MKRMVDKKEVVDVVNKGIKEGDIQAGLPIPHVYNEDIDGQYLEDVDHHIFAVGISLKTIKGASSYFDELTLKFPPQLILSHMKLEEDIYDAQTTKDKLIPYLDKLLWSINDTTFTFNALDNSANAFGFYTFIYSSDAETLEIKYQFNNDRCDLLDDNVQYITFSLHDLNTNKKMYFQYELS